MKNYWKPFAGWVTELRDDPFVWARIKLTALYTLSILVVLLVTNITLLRLWFTTLDQTIPGAINPHVRQELVTRLTSEIGRLSLTVYSLLILSIATISFLISSRTLSPILRIVQVQKRFMADASHELRTPLTIMKTNSEIALLDGEHIAPKEAVSTLKSNLEEIDRMSKIIENLLALSYYDTQIAKIIFQEISLSKLITGIITRTTPLAKKKTIDFRILNMDPGMIMGSSIAIEQVAMNLIKNAIAYTPEHGQISISVTAKNTVMEFKVKDNGIGIDKKDLSHIFNPFYKAGRARIQLEHESSGLGLTIVEKIVKRHQGSIYINSAVGKGTTIITTLPRYHAENLE